MWVAHNAYDWKCIRRLGHDWPVLRPRFTHDPQFYCKSQVQIAAQPTLETAHHEAFGHGNNVAAALLQQTFASEH